MSEYVNYNPDVLSCLANLSNDEVFTPPDVANEMLDMLPQELFEDPNAKFLDPACKTGVFLREIAKRLLKGLEKKIPDLQERIDHVFHNQLYGIAITELTALMSRRSVYCTKNANNRYSVSSFDSAEGNIRYKRVEHTWNGVGTIKNQKCIYCGASRSQLDRGSELETHAYEFIHIEDIYKMKFDLIIGNPPYNVEDGGNGDSSKPIYHLFVLQAKKLRPRYLSMITPSRWFNGGKGLDSYRKEMLSDRHITQIVDYKNAKECFPAVSIGGGVSFFLWERDRTSDCSITNIINGRKITETRRLDEYDTFIRFNDSVDIIKKVLAQSSGSIVQLMSPRNPFGLVTKERGHKSRSLETDVVLYSSMGKSFISPLLITQGEYYINKWKVLISRTSSEHAGEPDKNGQYKVLTTISALSPGEVCTDSYIVANPSEERKYVDNFISYIKTKFVRFLILQTLTSINLSREQYSFVPVVDFSKPWTDDELYRKYGLTEDEIGFIESMIKPMNGGCDD